MENILKTKAIINKMLDLEYNEEFEGEKITVGLLYEYFERLRKENKMDSQSQYFSDIKNGQRCVKKWRDMNDRQTPSTFEKYLILASIFSCDFRDIVYLEFDDEERARGAFEFQFSFQQDEESDDLISVDLPCIRDKMYHGVERFGFLKSDSETLSLRRKIKYDGKTTLDRALVFIRKNQLESTANELLNKLSSVIFAWKTRRAPVSIGLLIMFEQIMGIDILELYNPEYLNFNLNLVQLNSYFPKSRKDRLSNLNAGGIVKDKIHFFLEENMLKIHCVKRNTIVVRKNKKYGMIFVDGDESRYIPPVYEYITGSGDKIFAVESDKVFRISIESSDISDIVETATTHKGSVRQKFVYEVENIANALNVIINRGYRYFEIDGGIIVMDPEGKAKMARIDAQMPEGRSIKTFEKGRIYYGLMVNKDLIIPPIYEQKIIEGEGIYTVRKDGKIFFLNSVGVLLPYSEYDDASSFSEGLCVVSKNGKYGYINIEGEEAIPLQFEFATDFSEGLACITIGDKDGYIDRFGNLVISPAFSNGYKFNQGLSVVEKHGKYGYIDNKGEQILPCIYDNASAFSEGKVAVISCGKLITKKLKVMNC